MMVNASLRKVTQLRKLTQLRGERQRTLDDLEPEELDHDRTPQQPLEARLEPAKIHRLDGVVC